MFVSFKSAIKRSAIKNYPRVLQFPITYKCNSRCKICNIWKINKEELSRKQFEKVFRDPIFKKIESVGINGGEPTLITDLEFYVEPMISSFPELKALNIISNGFESAILLDILSKIYLICKHNNIKFHVSISLDGYMELHDDCRGVKGAFEKSISSINKIKDNLHLYADSYDVACTISSLNADYMVELDQFAKVNNINIKYRMAVEIRRLLNQDIYDSFNALKNFSAREHIFRKVKETKGLLQKFRYYSIFNSILSNKTQRLAGCAWQDEGITLDPYGNIYYCAVKSNSLGNILKNPGEKIFFSDKNIEHRKEIVKNCDTCLHDYSGKPFWRNFLIFLKFLAFNKLWCYTYKLKKHLI